MDYIKLQTHDGRGCAADSPILSSVEYCVGERDDDCTVIHVRGYVTVQKRGGSKWNVPFAGSTVIREGRDLPDQDIRVMDPDLDKTGELRELIAIEIHLLLDEFAQDFVAAEMNRICDIPGPGDA